MYLHSYVALQIDIYVFFKINVFFVQSGFNKKLLNGGTEAIGVLPYVTVERRHLRQVMQRDSDC